MKMVARRYIGLSALRLTLLLSGSLPALSALCALSALSVLAPQAAQAQANPRLEYNMMSPPADSPQPTALVPADPIGNRRRFIAARDYIFTDGVTSTQAKTIIVPSMASAWQTDLPILWDVPGIKIKGDGAGLSKGSLGGPFIPGMRRVAFAPTTQAAQTLSGITNRAYDLFGTGIDTSVVTGAGQFYGFNLNADSYLWFPTTELSLGPMPGIAVPQGWPTLTKFTWDLAFYFPVALTGPVHFGCLMEDNEPSPWGIFTATPTTVQITFYDSARNYYYFTVPVTNSGLVRVSIQADLTTGIAEAWTQRTKQTVSINGALPPLAGHVLQSQRYGSFAIGDDDSNLGSGSGNFPGVVIGYRLCNDLLYTSTGGIGSAQALRAGGTLTDSAQFFDEPAGKILFRLLPLSPTTKADAVNERVFGTRPNMQWGLWCQSGHGNPGSVSGPMAIQGLTLISGLTGCGTPLFSHQCLYLDVSECELNGQNGAAAFYASDSVTQYVTKLRNNTFWGGRDCAVTLGYGIADLLSNTVQSAGRTVYRSRGNSFTMKGTNLIAATNADTILNLISNTQQNDITVEGLNIDNESNDCPKIAFIRAEATSDKPTHIRIAPLVGGGSQPNVPLVLLARARNETAAPISSIHGLSTCIVDTPFWFRDTTMPIIKLDKSGWYAEARCNADTIQGGGTLVQTTGAGPGSVRAVPVPGPATSGGGGGPRTQRKAKKWRGRWRGQWRLPPGKRAA